MTSVEPVEFLLFAPSPFAEALAASLPTPLASERVLSFALEEETGVIFHRLQERVNTLLTPPPEAISPDGQDGSPEPPEEREEPSERGEDKPSKSGGEQAGSAETDDEEDARPPQATRPLLILCDQLGGRACTLALSLTHEPLEVLTGVNIPLLSALMHAPRGSLSELSGYLTETGQQAIRQSSVALTPLAAQPA